MERLLPAGDPRVEDWALMQSPLPTFLIDLLYLFIVWWGQNAMRKRAKPFNLRPIMLFYNFTMVIASAWLWWEFCAAGWFGDNYSFGCQPVDRSKRPKAMRIARACWFFYASKIVELFDTVCFILRKKFEQVSFLHVFHHAIMPISWWFGVKYVPGGLSTFHAMLNSLVHFFMYSYYGLAALGPQYQKYLWWKRYVLVSVCMDMQFDLVKAHSSTSLSMRVQDTDLGRASVSIV